MSTRELMQKIEILHESPENSDASTCGFERAMGCANTVEGNFWSRWYRGVLKLYF
jgi:hypothetical protein